MPKLRSNVQVASNGETALVRMKNQDFDLVLSEYKLTSMNGIEFLKKVKEQHPNVIRMLITGHSDINLAKEAINKAQVYNYIEKPCSTDELQTCVISALKWKRKNNGSNIIKVDTVKDAINKIVLAQRKILNKSLNSRFRDSITLEFNTQAEFNKFFFEVKQMKNLIIEDIHLMEDKYVIKVGVHLSNLNKI
jgi:YesN/AraC family two-component response regulator